MRVSTNEIDELIDFWREYDPQRAAEFGFHPKDDPRASFAAGRRRKNAINIINIDGWEKYRDAQVRGFEGNKLHSQLLPIPYAGDLKRAEIFFVLWNPGASAWCYQEEEEAAYRKCLLNSIKQDFSDNDYPFPFLNSSFISTSGYNWWEPKISWLAEYLVKRFREIQNYADALKQLSKAFAAIEIVPYRSTDACDKTFPSNLQSSKFSIAAINSIIRLASEQDIDSPIVILKKNTVPHLLQLSGRNIIQCNSSQGFHVGRKSLSGKRLIEWAEARFK